MSVPFLSPHLSLTDHVGHIQAPKAQFAFRCFHLRRSDYMHRRRLVVTIQAKVSAGQRCICDSSSRSYISSASRRQGVRSHLSLVVFVF